MLSEKQGSILIRLARQTIAEHTHLSVDDPVQKEELADPDLQAKRGVFVTLNKHGALRGCIGSLVGQESIVGGVCRNALNAAFHDSRFPPVTADEVPELHIDVSVLSEPRSLAYADGQDLIHKLRPHIDGVILRAPGGAGATFLPQVWEQLPDPQLFLSHLCLKAGLPQTAWKSGQLEVDTYQVQHFEENE
ncbi:MAG TPA: AmmeMemoRadiSam system protein A [Desulfobulbaceae bacterium]|nr:AmmeMemoRadiSam system protein A [Desulfobulbaceae bacterium]